MPEAAKQKKMQKISEKILKKKFPQVKPALLGGSPGLDPAAVNYFLQEVKKEVEELEKRNLDLEEKLEMIVEEVRSQKGIDVSATTQMPDENSEETKRQMEKIDRMERMYKRMILNLEKEIDEIKQEAKQESLNVVNEAKQKAEELLQEANLQYEEKRKEMEQIIQHSNDVRERLKSMAKYIDEQTV